MTTRTRELQFHAIAADVLQTVRGTGVDANGNAVARMTATGAEPLRCCLRDAAPGDEIMLFAYEPRIPASPYHETGPVFAHARDCGGLTAPAAYPVDWRTRRQIFRAYDERGWIHEATRVYEGERPEEALAEMFADPEVVQVHSRNVLRGCYMFAVTRDA